jgi:hypothetical protein
LTGGVRSDLGRDAVEEYLAFREPDPDDPGLEWPERLLPICHWGWAIYSCVDCGDDDASLVRFDPNPVDGDWSIAFAPEGRTLASILGPAGPAHAANMPDWAADFDSAGDAFEGGGGGGGGTWHPSPLHPDTASGGGGDVPTTCTSRPTPDGEELTCSPSYPADPLAPARPRPDYGVTTGSGGKGLADRYGDRSWYVDWSLGERLVEEYERLLPQWGAALGTPEVERVIEEMKRVSDKLLERGWRRSYDGWYPPFLCC